MRPQRALSALLGLTALTATAVRAQSPDWNAFLSVRPDPSAYIADWETDPSVVMLVLSYSGSTNVAFHLDGEIRRGSASVLGGRSTTFEFVGPSQLLLTTRDGIWEPNSVTYDPSLADQLERTGRMPDGEYQFCVAVREGLSEAAGGVLLATECVDFSITAPAPPSLVTPMDADTVFSPLPTFSWTPVTAGLNARVTYHLRIAEVLPNQTPLEAMNGNTPQLEMDLPIALFSYPQTELPLVDSARYVWQVQALDAAGQPFGERQGKSEVWTFTMAGWTGIPQPMVARMPDTLTLVPGVARLRGLRNVDGAESPTAYTLNGNVALDILSPFTAEAAVTLEDVSIDRAWLLDFLDGMVPEDGPAEVLSGRITGELDTLAMPSGSGAARFVRLRAVEYTPAGGLAFGGELLLPDRPAVALTGRVRLDGTNVAGTLSAEAPEGMTLFAAGDDPVRLDVRTVDVTFPAGELRLGGSLGLFGQEVACDGVTATVAEDGTATAAVGCADLDPFELMPGIEHVSLALDSVSGSVELDLADGSLVTYALETRGAVRLARGSSLVGCAATFEMSIATSGDGEGAVADLEAFGSECEDLAGTETADLDWLGLRLTNVRLERLAYSIGSGFDASLLLDIEPRVGSVPGLILPTITGVRVGNDGLTVPATEIDRAGTRVDVLGFGFRLTRYRLPSFTLGWGEWQAGSPDGFDFEVEGELSLPDFAPAPESCRARPLVLSGVSLVGGRLGGFVNEQSWEPSCALAIAQDISLVVDRVGGPFAVRLAPELVLEAGPDIEGSLVLPPLFQCADPTARRLALPGAQLNVGARGRVTGVVMGLEPACPLELPAAELSVTGATLTFGETDGSQSVVLDGDASAVLRLAPTPRTGTGSAAVDLVSGRLISGSLDFPGPLRLDLPREQPVLSFELEQAVLDAEGLLVDGRNRLLLEGGQTINSTFEALRLDADSLAITSGRVVFDAGFALEVGLDAAGDLSWRAVPTGQPVGTSIGVRADLPSEIALGPAGFTVSGDGTARLVYAGQDLDGLQVVFTDDFAVRLDPSGVRSGEAEFRLNGDRVAFLNQSGLQPDLDWFGDAIIPTLLPLPTVAVAYATLRDENGELLVEAENTPSGVRIFTSGDPVPISVPALQRDALVPPTVLATFDVTLDGLAREVAAGTIAVDVPPDQQADFPLFAGDAPQRVRVTDLRYESDEGLTLGGELVLPGAAATRFAGRARVTALGLFGTLTAEAPPGATLLAVGDDPVRLRVTRASLELPEADLSVAASLDLFRQELGCDGVTGHIAGDTLTTSISCAPTRPVELVENIDRLRLALRAIDGSASVDLASGQLLAHGLAVASELRLDVAAAADSAVGGGAAGSAATEPAICGADFELAVVDGAVIVNPDSFRARCDATEGDAELDWLALRLSNIELQRFEYRPGSGFDFALSLDAHPSVPAVPELDLPRLVGVQVGTDGLLVPAVDAPLTTERIGVAGFGVRVTRARLPGFLLAWSDWQARTPNGFDFALEGDLTLPAVGGGAGTCLDADPLVLASAGLGSGRVELALGERTYEPGCPILLGPELAFEVASLSGSLTVQVGTSPTALVVERTPDIQGALLLPSFFSCTEPDSARMSVPTRLTLGADRRITGTATGLAVPCPIDLAALAVTISEASLELTVAADTQSVVLSGAAVGTFALAEDPIAGSGTMAVDLVQGRMLSGMLEFDGPFRLDLPRENPALSFLIEEASLDTAGVHIEGGQRLTLATSASTERNIDVTFDDVTINPAELALTAGAIRFDAPFAFEVSISDEGSLAWRAVEREAPLSVATGLRVDLPTDVALTPSGLVSAGDAAAELRFRGRDVDSLRVAFSEDFAVALDPFGVREGRADLVRAGESVAHIDRGGFRPNFAYFARELLPARLGLPTVDVAYVQLRDEAGSLLVESESTGSGTRVATTLGAFVPLVVPALQLDRAEAPRLDVAFEIVLNELGEGLASGAIRARVPPERRDAFDLSSDGLPVRIDTLAYESDAGSPYAFTVGGSLVLFGDSAITGGAVELTLDASGRLTGDVTAELSQRVRLMPGDDRLALQLTRAEGTFDASLTTGSLEHDLELTGAVEVAPDGGDGRSVAATLHLSERGVSVTRIEAQGDEVPAFFDAGLVRLGLTNLRVPRLEFAYQTGAWDFELLFDMHLAFPALDSLVLPPLRDVTLSPTGFAVPEYAVPELAVEPFTLAGFSARPLAFRSDAFAIDWRSSETLSDPGFAFDLELTFPETAPAELRDTRLSVLDAGYSDGGFTGTVERRELPDPLRLPLAEDGLALDIDALGGALLDSQEPGGGAQTVAVTAEGSLVLPELMRCETAPAGTLPLPGAILTLSSAGRISGTASNVLPECPAVVGPLAFRLTSSELTFDVGADGDQRAELFAAAELRLPGLAAGDTITATGDLGLDLAVPRVTRGSVQIDSPFRWTLPWSSESVPLFAFVVSEASIDEAGLHLTGSGQAEFYDWELVDVGSLGQAGAIAEGTAEVVFEDLTLALPDYTITAGSVGFTESFAFDAGFEQSKPRWRAADESQARRPGPGLRVTLPPDVSLSADGLSLGGTATAELTFGEQAFPTLSVAFADDFLFGYDPVGVASGRATFLLEGSEIAYVDPAGFWPGDVFGVLPVPARLGLPSEDIAYLQLRDANDQLLVESDVEDDGVRLRTRGDEGVQLVIPALADESGAPATVNVQFDVTANAASYQITEGSVRAVAGDDGGPLFRLGAVPLEVREVLYQPGEDGHELRVDARLALPASLGGMEVVLEDLLVGENGLSGTAEVGTYTEHFDPELTPVASYPLAENVDLDLLGTRVTFGDSTVVEMSGVVRTPLFAQPEGGPAAIFFAGGLGPSGLALAVDPLSLPDGRLPLGLLTFEPQAIGDEPATRITVTDQELTVRLSGVLRAPTLSDEFAATIQGLEVGTRGIVLPTVSLTESEDQQELSLFGATFALRDSTGVYPAIALEYENDVFAVTMSGEVSFLDHAARFYGLRVTSVGDVSLAAANLLTEPIILAESLLTLDSLGIADSRLRAAFGVTLPEPLGDGEVQRVAVGIAPDGTVEGTGRVVVREEEPGLGGDRTLLATGLATVHTRYIGLTIDPTDLDRSGVEVVADIYLRDSEDNRIQVGDLAGGTVSPGLSVGFDGTVEWGNVSLPREFEFDFEAVRLTLAQVSAGGTGSRFWVGMSGELALDITAAEGALAFTDVRIDDGGRVDFGAAEVEGGEITIGGVVNLQVEGFAYSSTPTTIEVAGGSMPTTSSAGTATTESVEVSSYVRFGGRIDVVDVLAGGVEEVLLYETAEDGRTHLIVRQAALDVYDVVSMQADLRYREIAGGFEMVLGAQGQLLDQYDVMLVGAIEQGNGANRFGMFLATGVTIPIPAVPVVVISQLGGGFFYNPKPEYLDLVRQYAGVSQTAQEKIVAPVGQFAGLLYGAAVITPAAVAEGRVLLTVMPTALQIDGAVTILNQGNRLRGDAHLVLGVKKTYAEGNIVFNVDYDPVLDGAGQMEFYVYSPEVWGITGSTDVSLVEFFDGDAALFIGPPGFLASFEVDADFDIWKLDVKSDFTTTAWYESSEQDWGAYADIRVKADILDGTITASGTLQSALISEGGSPFVFGAGKIEGCIVGQCASKRVWAKFRNGNVTADWGRNSELEDLLDEAQDVADEITAAAEEAQAAAEQAELGALSLSYDELAAAYERIQGWPQERFDWLAQQSTGVEAVYAPQPGEGSQFGWYLNVLQQAGAPADTALIRSYSDSVDAQLGRIAERRAAVSARIGEISANLLSAQSQAETLIPGSPVSQMSFAPPVTRIVVDAAGDTSKVLESGPGFIVDPQAAEAVRSAMDEWRLDAERADQEARALLQQLESTLAEMRAVTQSGDEGSLLEYARLHAGALSTAEQQYAAQADHVLRKQDWMRARLAEQGAPDFQADLLATAIQPTSTQTVASPVGVSTTTRSTVESSSPSQYASQAVYALVNRYTAIRNIIMNKTRELQAEDPARLRELVIYREVLLDEWLGTGGARLAQFVQQEAGFTPEQYAAHADSTGMYIWYHLARAGMQAADAGADDALADVVTMSEQRLGGIQEQHGAISSSLDRLYGSQAALTGVLHDAYGRYVSWRTESLGDSASAGDEGLEAYRARQSALAQELAVPRVTGVQVTSLNQGYRSTQTVQWSGTHPRGAYEFSFRDVPQTEAGLDEPLFSNGAVGSWVGHRFLRARGWTEPPRSFEAGVRGGAGFVGFGRADYTVTFQQVGAGPGSSTTYVELADATPPSVPVIELVGSTARLQGDGGSEAWTTAADAPMVRWSASDPESGISEFEYAVGSAPEDTSVRPWTAVGGRSEIRLEGITLSESLPIHVSVRARNGRGQWGAIGASPAIRWDPTPPTFPVGASVSASEPVEGAATPTRTLLLPACTVPEPNFPLTVPERGVTPSLETERATTWDGSLTRDGASDGTTPTTAVPERIPPRRSFTWPHAEDAESGLSGYRWRIDSTPPTTLEGAGWTTVPSSQTSITVTGAPLDYDGQFYLTIVAVNWAGSPTEPITFGPFEVPDPTRPSNPSLCASIAPSTDRLVVAFTSSAEDRETRVLGYRYRVRSGTTIVRDWPADLLDWTDARLQTAATEALVMTDGLTYYVDVRALNGDGLFGDTISSGPVLVDASPPPTPTVTALFDGTSTSFLRLRITGATDPHSGFMTQQLAVGTGEGQANVVAWRNVPGAVPGEYTVDIPLDASLTVGGAYWAHIRTVNGAGLASPISAASFTVPTPRRTSPTAPLPRTGR